MRLVVFDTVGPVIGVAVCAGEALAVRTERVTRRAESRLLPWAVELCQELGSSISQIDGVGVAVGPGAFTGLRVGLATAGGLAQAVGCPVWGGCSLRARAQALIGAGRPVLSMLDARKSRVYAALYDSSGGVIRAPADVEPAQAIGWAPPGAIAVGEGAAVYGDQVVASGLELAEPIDDPGVGGLLRLCQAGLNRGEGVDATELRPVYLRAPDAVPPRRR